MKNPDKEERGYPDYSRQSRRTLTGAVDSREAKRRAESVSGVRNVQNNIRVQQGGAPGAMTSKQPKSRT